ncbi:head-tail connector protein [Pseudahrensia aquimaris]|uniref:Head-tail connector protein n=1 Tax=Pseudahrensia aquimaris TaxID=744461 RepID=A0ABW3FGG4_9HYPH
MTTALITPAALEPLTIAEIKTHLRIDHDHEDTLLAQTLEAARAYVEFASGTKLITQLWRQYENCFPSDRRVKLRIQPFQSVDTVTVFDHEGTPTILAPADYAVRRDGDAVIIEFAASLADDLAVNGLEVDCVFGFGDLGIDVPPALRRAILLLVAHWYEFRGAISPQDQPVSLPPGFDALMAPFNRVRL